MHPQGLFGIDSLRLLLSPIAVFGILFFVLYLRREGIRAGRTVVLLLLTCVVALLGAKLFSLFVRGWDVYEPLSAELRGGWRYPGALLAMVLGAPLLLRWLLPGLPLTRFLDVLAITVCFCFALVRFSCYMNGCCTGFQCDGGYCLSYAPGSQVWYNHLQDGLLHSHTDRSLPVLPLHFLFMAASLGVGLFLLWYDGRRSFNGQIALLYLVLHDGAKGLLESFREPYVAELQLTSLLISGAGLVALIVISRRRAAAGKTVSGDPALARKVQ
ncbi:MAG: prolipoprotein diacylglyceryl transferase family protein [Halioglobus sp.]|nr:prolipoprotein diacylglyceryl transferase family protein [Halioglobus sp.]